MWTLFRMMRSVLCKLLQRRTYDILSHKYGVVLLIISTVLIIFSSIHFSEVVLEWSKEKYAALSQSFRDNISGKSFQNRLCVPMPIDVVYTWVNGSDPLLIKELRNLKYQMTLKNKTRLSSETDVNCTYSNCIPTKMVVITPMLPADITNDILIKQYRIFKHAVKIIKMKSEHDTNITTAIFEKDMYVQRAASEKLHFRGSNYTVHQGYLTTEWTVPDSVLLGDTVIMTGFKSKYTVEQITKKIPQHIQANIKTIKLYEDNSIAAIVVTNTATFHELTSKEKVNFTIDGQTPVITAATLAWNVLQNSHHSGDDLSASRFQDNDELKFSIRSVEKFAPWVHHIYIVTNGQIPAWLNLENPRVTIVTHQEIFVNKSHLPTYNSASIEAHIHRIPGLSKKFIYMNDDVFFGKEVWPDDFFTHSEGQKVYLSWPVPNCRPGCPASWIKDGYCDKACNNSECEWDAGDCAGGGRYYGGAGRSYGGVGWNKGSRFDISKLYCNQGCANSWIADRYCDKACNVIQCGFDAGDCGINNLDRLHRVDVKENKILYYIPKGTTIAYFNLSSIFNTNTTLKEGMYAQNDAIRTATLANKFKMLNVILYPDVNETILHFYVKGEMSTDEHTEFSFNVSVDTVKTAEALAPLPPSENVTTKSLMTLNATHDLMPMRLTVEAPFTFRDVPRRLREPNVNKQPSSLVSEMPDVSKYVLPENITETLRDLKIQLQEGDITLKGYNILVWKIWKPYVDDMQSRGYSLMTKPPLDIEPTSASLTSKDQSVTDEIWRETPHQSKPVILRKSDILSEVNMSIPQQIDQRKNRLHFNSRGLLSVDNELWDTNSEEYPGFLPWEKAGTFSAIMRDRKERDAYMMNSYTNRRLLDTFGDSLRHVNKIYNKAFGHEARKVPGHMPHMIDRSVMDKLQDRFPEQWAETSSHKIRSSDDMQFSFSYFYYLMSEPLNWTISEVFHNMDTDASGVLSDRELRTLVTRLYDLPLDLQTLTKFENFLINCSRHSNVSEVPIELREEYYVKDMPQVTPDLIDICQPIAELILDQSKGRKKYKYQTLPEQEIAFKMIRSNVSYVVNQLDDIRKHPKKFICLNDNIDHALKGSDTVKAVLVDFYETMFPRPSQFELPHDFRNRFLYMHQLQAWRNHRNRIRLWMHMAVGLVILFTFYSYFQDKIYLFYKRLRGRRKENVHDV